ncbi:scavenger receptor class B member 1-like [Ostrinia furnacalis]|uniref:Scavenger receptor class B member 1 n=1 Tax=Ostrinia furnacalis TaxID=93504 RepID=A0A8F3BNJ2_OSTFU|nr:scavenger receptor class B member 1-like [Ostrinia furnacalis]QWX20070.1 scavenger receptor class B member 1 [Ostrinia furnacalis]
MEYSKTKRKDGVRIPTKHVKRKLMTFLPLSAVCVAVAILLIYVDAIQIIANYRTHLTYGSEIHELLSLEAHGIHVSAYLFNVTNGDAFLSGEDDKMKVEEIGPFTYKELRSNLDIEFDEEARVVRYSPLAKPVFMPDESIAHPRDVVVTMPNIAMLAMSSMTSKEPYFTQLAFKLLLNHLKTKSLVNQTAEEFLWGYDEPLIKLGNTILPGWISFEKLGLMDRLYDTKTEYRLEVAMDQFEKFHILKMNGVQGLKVWDFEDPTKRSKCNSFADAYEGIMYPNEMKPGTSLKIFRNVLCRFLPLDYQGKLTLETGVDALQYKVSKTTYDINNETECLCGRGMCISGVSDLSPCYYSLPLALSNAHFLYGDSKLFERVEGLSPNEEQHGSNFLIEPRIGIALKSEFSVQVNVVVNKVDFNKEVERFSEFVVPICYFKMVQPELLEANKYNLNLMYVIGPAIVLSLQIFLVLLGLLILAYCVYLLLPHFVRSSGQGIIFQTSKDNKSPATKLPLLGSR